MRRRPTWFRAQLRWLAAMYLTPWIERFAK